MKFTTQQLQSYVLTFWNFLSFKSDEFQRVPGHFMDLKLAPELNQSMSSHSFYHWWFLVYRTGLMKLHQQPRQR